MDVPLLGEQVCCVQPEDTLVFNRRPGEVRTAEREERLLLAVRLAAQHLLEEAGLDEVVEEGLHVAPWRGT